MTFIRFECFFRCFLLYWYIYNNNIYCSYRSFNRGCCVEMNGSTSLKIKNIMNIIYQGNIALDGSTRIIGTSNNLIINSIIINNQDYNYIVTVESYNQDPGVNKIILYNFELTAGDCLKDNDEYSLTNGNYLQLTSNVAETSYYIKATQN